MNRKNSKISEEDISDLKEVRSKPITEDIEIYEKKPVLRCSNKGHFQEYMVDEVVRLARFGLTNNEIAEFYGIAPGTFQKYCSLYQDLSDALHLGRMMDGLKVVESLHKQAIGYDVEEETIEYRTLKDGTEIQSARRIVKKHIPGNATSAIYLLKARFPDRWNEVSKVETSSRIDININKMDLSDVNTDELLLLKKLGLKSIPMDLIHPVKPKNLN